MGGGLIQLVAYGSQDIYLTGNPQITFFKLVYRRHTNFSMESIKQTIDGSNTITSSAGGRGSVTIDRNGDLLSKIYVVTKGANIIKGNNIIQEVKLEIGGQTIDTHSQKWLNNWLELTTPGDKHLCLSRMVGREYFGNNIFIHRNREQVIKTIITSQIPLQFWFCRNPGLALPLIALQYHEIILHFTWGNDIFRHPDVGESSNQTATCEIWCDYIYLDTDERRRFAQTSHEYLIEQVQEMSFTSGNTRSVNGSQLKMDLNLNHPVKELFWDYEGILFSDITLELNGHERFAKQQEEYFTLRQPYEYHAHVPHNNLVLDEGHKIPPLSHNIIIEYNGGGGRGIVNTRGINRPVFQIRNSHDLSEIKTSPAPFMSDSVLVLSNDIPFISAIQVGTILTFTEDDDNTMTATTDTTSFEGPSPFSITIINLGNGWAQAGDALDEDGDVSYFMIDRQATLTIPIDNKVYNMEFSGGSGIDSDIFGIKYTDSVIGKRIGVYSFALKPEEHQPSGTCNFSRIDTAKLIGNYNPLDTTSGDTINIYAVNYNVLRIMSGMGGLAYSN